MKRIVAALQMLIFRAVGLQIRPSRSHKPGKSFVTRYDGNGALIKNPAKANHRSWVFYDGKLTSVNYNLGGVRLWVRR